MYSSDTVFPTLRFDLQVNFVNEENQMYAVLQDPFEYVDHPIMISYDFYLLLASFDGVFNVEDFQTILKLDQNSLNINTLLEQIEQVDKLGFLNSPYYYEIKHKKDQEYLTSSIRKPICAGSSYPVDKIDLENYLTNFFEKCNGQTERTDYKALIVPHIDFRLGALSHEIYSIGYKSIEDTEFDLVVILGTAHYANSNYFMMTNKDFQTPLGILETDKEIVEKCLIEINSGVVLDDFAHKPEHSIELQIVLLQHLFKNRKFKVLPILVGSFYDDITGKTNPMNNPYYYEFISKFNDIVNSKYNKVLFIASVDLAHIGRKFGDTYDAVEMLDTVKEMDYNLIDKLVSLDGISFYNQIMEDQDKWKICGTSPIYTLMNLLNPNEIKLLKYNQWNETETSSAVTFASLAIDY